MAQVIAYTPHIHQARFHASPARFKLARAGRQSGKSLGAIAELTSWVTEKLGRGLYYWTTANYRVKDRAWRGLAEHLPKEIVKKRHESDLYVELRNGSRIYIRSADAPESLVSETLDGLVCDEAAQWKPDVWPQHLRPMLAVNKAPAVFIGTPRGRNWFFDLEQYARSGDPEWAAFSWRSIESPYFSKEEWMRAKEEMPERLFRQEIEAEYIEGGGEVFRNVDAAIAPYGPRDDYTVLGIDLGRHRDFTVLWATNSLGEAVAVQHFTNLDWSTQKVRIIELATRLRVRQVLIDATGMHVGADAVVDDLRAAYLPVQPVVITAPLKRAMIEGLMLRFDQGSIHIPEEAAEEFRAFTFETSASGHDRYSAPAGRHDDYVMAAALAIYGIRMFQGRPIATQDHRNDLERRLDRHAELEMARASSNYVELERLGEYKEWDW